MLGGRLQRLVPGALFVAYAGLVGLGWAAVAQTGDDGVRVRPQPRGGLTIVRVLPNTPAARAGLRPADPPGQSVIVGVDGLVTRDEQALQRAFDTRAPGRKTRLSVQGTFSGTGSGMGIVHDYDLTLTPRLETPAVAARVAVLSLAGLASAAAATAGLRGAGPLPGSPATALAGALASILEAGVWSESARGSGAAASLAAALPLGGWALAVLLRRQRLRRTAVCLTLAAATEAVAWFMAAAAPQPVSSLVPLGLEAAAVLLAMLALYAAAVPRQRSSLAA